MFQYQSVSTVDTQFLIQQLSICFSTSQYCWVLFSVASSLAVRSAPPKGLAFGAGGCPPPTGSGRVAAVAIGMGEEVLRGLMTGGEGVAPEEVTDIPEPE
jgi:hypothetical protein